MDTNEIYNYIKNKEFIVTHEWRFGSKNHEPCGRPVVTTIIDVDVEKGIFQCALKDYDENVTCINRYRLPVFDDFHDQRKGALQFDIGDGKQYLGRYLVTRFWEV